MIVQKDFLNKLKDFGLNSYESKLWTALLSRGVSTAGELSDIANVPRSRSYDVLESLEKKGFIIMKLGKPIKYIAVPPEEVLERVKKRIEDDAQKQTKIVDDIRGSEVLNELNVLHLQGIELIEPTDLSGALKGRGNLYSHVESMIKSAESTVDIMTTSNGLARKADVLRSILIKAKERGVKVRIAAPLNEKTKKAEEDLKEIVDIRHIDKLKARFCLVDGVQMTFMLLDDDEVHPTYDTGIWVNTPFFASALKTMFETEWNALQTIKH